MEVACHCGGVTLQLPHAPEKVLHCNCSICRKSGFLGVYYPPGEVTIAGEMDDYVRSDMETPCLRMFRCRTCGIFTHWMLHDDWPYDDMPKPDRMGVNARLFDPAIIDGLPTQQADGASR